MLRKHAWIIVVLSAAVLTGGLDPTTRDALKVQHILKTIERKPPTIGDAELSAEVTEKELNAYIAYRLARKKKPIVSDLTVTLLDNNQIRGKISFDAERLNLGSLLGEKLAFDFTGVVQSRNRTARLNLVALSLGGYAVKPQVLDFVLSSAGMLYNTEVGGVEDWYALPKGIKRIMVKRARATLYY